MGSAAVEFGSGQGAKDARDFRHHDALLPCRKRCDIVISDFDVPGIPDAEGVERSRTSKTASLGPGGSPFEGFEVSFVDGQFLYVVRGAVELEPLVEPARPALTKDDVIAAAKTLFARVKGAPLPS
jgi:hypothetical protein